MFNICKYIFMTQIHIKAKPRSKRNKVSTLKYTCVAGAKTTKNKPTVYTKYVTVK